MWNDHKTLNRINESIAGWHTDNCYRSEPYYIRYNPNVEIRNSIEYTTEEQPEVDYPDEIFKTSAGEIDLYDEGEFGGHLAIGGKTVCQGNFSKIFEFKGSKYVIDDLRHMMSYTFRLISVNDNGTIDVLYDADQYAALHDVYYSITREDRLADPEVCKKFYTTKWNRTEDDIQRYKLDLDCSVGLDSFYIGKDFCGAEKVFFLCSGHIFNHKKEGRERFTDVQYLLMFDPENEANPFIKIELPADKVEFSGVSSIWTDGIMLAIGCDREVVMVHLPDMSAEYWTELETEEVEEILKHKHKYR